MKDYNFFEDYTRKKSVSIDVGSPYFIAILIVLVCVAISIGLVARNMILVSQIQTVNLEVQTIKESQAFIDASAHKESIDAMKQYDQSAEAILNKFKESDLISTDMIRTITGKIPSSVSMTTINMDNAGANLTFNVPNKKAAAELILGLKNTGLFQEVQLNTISPGPEGIGSVADISAIMKAGEAK